MDGEEVLSPPHPCRSAKPCRALAISFLCRCCECCTSHIGSLLGRATAVSISHLVERTPLAQVLGLGMCLGLLSAPQPACAASQGPLSVPGPWIRGTQSPLAKTGNHHWLAGASHQRAPSFGLSFLRKDFIKHKGNRQVARDHGHSKSSSGGAFTLFRLKVTNTLHQEKKKYIYIYRHPQGSPTLPWCCIFTNGSHHVLFLSFTCDPCRADCIVNLIFRGN